MSTIPEVVPISELRIRQAEILEKLPDGPVVLARRGHATAVLVSLEKWNALMERLEDLEDALDALEIRARIASGEESLVDFDEYLASRGERVPVEAH